MSGFLATAIAQAQIADDAWSAALPSTHNARYLPAGKGASGSELRALHDWYLECSAAMHAAFKACRD